MRIGKKEAALVFARLKSIMEENREELIRLDAALGDGDLGITMTKAFSAVEAKISEIDARSSDPGRMFALAGAEIAKSAPSTMGTLLASAFLKAGKSAVGKETMDAADLAVFLAAFAAGIADLGAAKPGDKTILDVLYPAAEAAAHAAEKGDIHLVMKAALEAAEKGLETSKAFMAKHGRPGIFREKTIGLLDPGAATGVLIVRAFTEALSGAAERH